MMAGQAVNHLKLYILYTDAHAVCCTEHEAVGLFLLLMLFYMLTLLCFVCKRNPHGLKNQLRGNLFSNALYHLQSLTCFAVH